MIRREELGPELIGPFEQAILDGLYNAESALDAFPCQCGRECVPVEATGPGYIEPLRTVRADGRDCCSGFGFDANPLVALERAIGHYALLEQGGYSGGASAHRATEAAQSGGALSRRPTQ